MHLTTSAALELGKRVRGAAVEIVLVAALLACAVAALGRGFSGTGYLTWTVLAVVGGVLTALPAWSRRPLLLPGAVSAVVLVALLVYGPGRPTLRHGLPSAATVRLLRDGALHGLTRFLTTSIPVDPSPDLVVLPAILAWAAAFVAVALAARTTSPPAPLIPPAAYLVGALAITATSHAPRTALTALWIGLALLLVLVRANRRAGAKRVLTAGVGIAALVTTLASIAAAVVPVADPNRRADPRSVRMPPTADVHPVSPLASLQGELLLAHPRPVMRVSFPGRDGAAPVDRIRVAALSRYDGIAWTFAGAFARAGTQLPTRNVSSSARTVRVDIEQSADTPYGSLIPSIGQATRVGGAAIEYDAADGNVVAPGAPPKRIDLVAALVTPSPAQLEHAVADATVPAALVIAVPSEFSVLANQIVATATTPYQRLVALQTYVRSLPNDIAAAKPGTSLFNLEQLVRRTSGYTEQHAALFAVLATAAGLPARVAVGYRVGQRSTAGAYLVETSDAMAWPEVALSGLGWVPVDVTGAGTKAPTRPTQAPKKPLPSTAGASDAAGPLTGRGSIHATRHSDGSLWPLVVTALIVGVLMLGGGVVAAKRTRRSRRRTRGSVSDQTVGAWRSIVDTLAECGVTVPRSTTPLEAGRQARVQHPWVGDHLDEVGDLVSVAIYAPGDPPPTTASAAWAHADELHGLSRRRMSPPRRLLAEIDPRPVLTVPALRTFRLPFTRRDRRGAS